MIYATGRLNRARVSADLLNYLFERNYKEFMKIIKNMRLIKGIVN